MVCCAVCSNVTSENCKRDILLDKIGDPPALISEILVKITIDTEFQFTSTEVCNDCTNKLEQYYAAIQSAEQFKLEILALLETDTKQEFECLYAASEDDACVESIDSKEIILTIDYKEEQEEFLDADLENRIESVIKKAPPKGRKRGKRVCAAIKNEESDTTKKDIKKSKTKGKSNEETKKQTFDCSGSKGISMYHESGVGQPIGIQCEICDRMFAYARTFHAHKKYQDFVGYICEICGIQCLTKAGMKDHAKVHKPDKEFQCPHCNAQFHRKLLYQQHMAYHTDERPFQCDVCAKCFAHKVALKVHQKIHTDNYRRIECEFCDKKFRTVTHKRRHMPIHTGAKPFPCPICGNRFSQADNMRAHMKLHKESTSAENDVVTKPLKCQKCSRKCTNILEYEEHIKSC